jgi:hypothetical protein
MLVWSSNVQELIVIDLKHYYFLVATLKGINRIMRYPSVSINDRAQASFEMLRKINRTSCEIDSSTILYEIT